MERREKDVEEVDEDIMPSPETNCLVSLSAPYLSTFWPCLDNASYTANQIPSRSSNSDGMRNSIQVAGGSLIKVTRHIIRLPLDWLRKNGLKLSHTRIIG